MTRVVAITSGKGGVGKTVIGINLALHLAGMGRKVCLFDADLGLANVNILLRLFPEFTLEDVLDRRKTLTEIVMRGIHGIDIIPGSAGLEVMANLPAPSVRHFLKSVAGLPSYDFVLFDTSSGIQESTLAFALAADEIILVVTPDPTSLLDGYAVLKVLHLNGDRRPVRLLVNQCENKEAAQAAYRRIKGAAQKHLGLEVVPLGLVLADNRVETSVRRQEPLAVLFPDSPASRCLKAIAARLADHKPSWVDEADLTAFWSRYLRQVSGSVQPDTESPIAGTEPAMPISAPDMAIAQAESPASEAVPSDSGTEPAEASHDRIETLPETDRAAIEEHIRGLKPARDAFASNSERSKVIAPRHLFGHPQIHDTLLEALSSRPDSESDAVRLVCLDPGLAASVLKLAQPLLGRHNGYDTEQAVKALGPDVLRNLILTQSAAMDIFRRDRSFMSGLTDFWRHGAACAILSGLIAKALNLPSPDRAYLSGLVHDIGRLVAAGTNPESDMVELHSGLTDIAQPTRHGRIGADLIQAWGLPSFLADAARYHHEKSERIREAWPLVKVVHAANILVSRPEDEIVGLMGAISGLVGLPEEKLVDLIARAALEMSSAASALGLDWTGPDRPSTHGPDRTAGNSLLDGFTASLIHSPGLDACIAHAHYSLEILFGSVETMFFLLDEEKGLLRGNAPNGRLGNAPLSDFVIPVDHSAGLPALAFRENRVVLAETAGGQTKSSLGDEMLLRLLNKPEMICLPLTAHGRKLGVLTIGVEAGQAAVLSDRDSSPAKIADLAALAVDAERLRMTDPKADNHVR